MSQTQNPDLPSKQKQQVPLEKPDSLTDPIFDISDIAPSPSKTYYQLCVYPYQPQSKDAKKNRPPRGEPEQKKLFLNRDRIKEGCVVVRDWPMKRLSQHWKRDGLVNPSEQIITFDEFIGGEMDTHLISIFGREKYLKCVKVVEGQILVRDLK
jgi:hypothetical protein